MQLTQIALHCIAVTFRSLKDNELHNIESVVVTYQSLTFVCFQTGGIWLNSKSLSMSSDGNGLSSSGHLKRKNDDAGVDAVTEETMKRLRAATGNDDGESRAIGCRTASASDSRLL